MKFTEDTKIIYSEEIAPLNAVYIVEENILVINTKQKTRNNSRQKVVKSIEIPENKGLSSDCKSVI